MEIRRVNNLDVRKTVERAVSGNPEFHFYVDELSADGFMPTYEGLADEKYTFDEMDEGFFEFINRKIHENGVYLRICYMTGEEMEGEAIFVVEMAGESTTFKTNDLDNVCVVEMADYGVKITPDELIFGATIDGGCAHTPYFAEFGSERCNETFMSLDNPLNRYVIGLIGDFIDSI